MVGILITALLMFASSLPLLYCQLRSILSRMDIAIAYKTRLDEKLTQRAMGWIPGAEGNYPPMLVLLVALSLLILPLLFIFAGLGLSYKSYEELQEFNRAHLACCLYIILLRTAYHTAYLREAAKCAPSKPFNREGYKEELGKRACEFALDRELSKAIKIKAFVSSLIFSGLGWLSVLIILKVM